MTEKERREKIALLRDGQVVEIANDWFRACRVAEGWEGRACEACDLDCLCKDDVAAICNELDWPFGSQYYLKLAHP